MSKYTDILDEDRNLILCLKQFTAREASDKIADVLDKIVDHIAEMNLQQRALLLDLFLKWKTYLFKEYRIAYAKNIFDNLQRNKRDPDVLTRMKRHIIKSNTPYLNGRNIKMVYECKTYDDLGNLLVNKKDEMDQGVSERLKMSTIGFVYKNLDNEQISNPDKLGVGRLAGQIKHETPHGFAPKTTSDFDMKMQFILGKP